jgi:hypothetical protein
MALRDRNYLDDGISNARRERQREVLAALYVSLGNAARDAFTIVDLDEVADLAKVSKGLTGDYVQGLDRCDVIKSRIVRVPYQRSDGHNIEVTKREVMLHLPHDQALERLNEVFDQERRTQEVLTLPAGRLKQNKKPAPVVRVVPNVEPAPEEPPIALATETSRETTRAIAGPEHPSPFAVLSPLRKDEYAALTEAARQYANRKAEFAKVIENLRGMGIEIDDAKLDKAVRFPVDPHMEAICEILPYVNRLEGMVENLTRQLVDARQKAVDYAEMKKERDSLRAQLQRKVAESIAARQRE